MKGKNLLVVSGHAADFVWRAGGTIAKYIEAGANVTVVVLSYGIRGESNDLWKTPGQTYENVKKIRREEAEAAAAALGVKNIEFWDYQDYPIIIDQALTDRLVRKMRETKAEIILSHSKGDAFNPDHEDICQLVWRASVMAISAGVVIEGLPHIKQPMLFGFEPHQTEISGFVPEVILDITETYDAKIKAMNCFKAQQHLIQYYTDRAFLRGNHARRASGNNNYRYAEAFTRKYPYVGGEFR